MQVTVIGTGYVGLVSGATFAELGHTVTCVDVDQVKIDNLRNGEIPIYEPGLEQLVRNNQQAGRLQFTTRLADALQDNEIVFVAVGTPQREDGSADLKYVFQVVDQIRDTASTSQVVVVKSTVPVGTNARVAERLNAGSPVVHYAASNPEFLREGLAVSDSLNPDRVVVGVRDEIARQKLEQLYQPFLDQEVPLLVMSPESSEMTKYVANCILATRLSYINEMANMCEAVDADVEQVRQGIGYDPRIGFRFIAPGAGYGGSCFPKDVRAMMALAREKAMPMTMLAAVDEINERQKRRTFEKLVQLLDGETRGKTLAVWGLAFKPETDDIREAPALTVIEHALDAGMDVRVFDPQAMPNVQTRFGDVLTYAATKEEAAHAADALVIVTEWQEFSQADLAGLAQNMRGQVVVDGRNLFEPNEVAQAGLIYASVGRATARPATEGASPVNGLACDAMPTSAF